MKADTITWNEGKTELKEVYVQKASKDTPAVRIVFQYSGKMNHIRESLNHVLDSTKKMKLYKTEIVVAEFYDRVNKRLQPLMKFTTEMKEINVENTEEIESYINRYKQRNRQLN